MKKLVLAAALSVTSIHANAADVTVESFARAETDNYIRGNMSAFNASVGDLMHIREPLTATNQTVIRQNQDTIYSGIVVDLSQPVQIVLPEIEGRYQSMHVINQDHFMYVESSPGTYELTEEGVGTRFAMVNFRTFVNPNDPADISAAHAVSVLEQGYCVEVRILSR